MIVNLPEFQYRIVCSHFTLLGNLSHYGLAASDLCQTAPTLEIQKSWPTVLPGRSELEQITNTTQVTASQIPSLYEDISLHETTMIESGCANVGQMESRWYLDVTSGVCKEFAYSHCGGSTNNFLARTDCEQFCAAKKEDPAGESHFCTNLSHPPCYRLFFF